MLTFHHHVSQKTRIFRYVTSLYKHYVQWTMFIFDYGICISIGSFFLKHMSTRGIRNIILLSKQRFKVLEPIYVHSSSLLNFSSLICLFKRSQGKGYWISWN